MFFLVKKYKRGFSCSVGKSALFIEDDISGESG